MNAMEEGLDPQKYMESSVNAMANVIETTLLLEGSADRSELLQLLDARQKIDTAEVVWEQAWAEFFSKKLGNSDLIQIITATRDGVNFTLHRPVLLPKAALSA